MPRFYNKESQVCDNRVKLLKESNECKIYATQLKDMIRMTSASEVFCEFGHPMQGEPPAILKDIHIFLVKDEKL
mgnify:CR=1 FL=1